MKFTGSLIEDLMTKVEQAEARAQAFEVREIEPLLAAPLLLEPWLTSVPENTEYDSKFLGVA